MTKRTSLAFNALRWSLILLALPASLLALLWLQVGLGFGFDLWRADRPFAIALWFAGVLFPVYLIWTAKAWKPTRKFVLLACIAWLFVGFWAYDQFVWQPWAYGGPWGW